MTATLWSTAGSPSGLRTQPARTSTACACRPIATWSCTPSATNPSGTPTQPTSAATCVASIWPTRASWWFTGRPSRSGATTMPDPAQGPGRGPWTLFQLHKTTCFVELLNPSALKSGNKQLTVHSWLLSWCFLIFFSGVNDEMQEINKVSFIFEIF